MPGFDRFDFLPILEIRQVAGGGHAVNFDGVPDFAIDAFNELPAMSFNARDKEIMSGVTGATLIREFGVLDEGVALLGDDDVGQVQPNRAQYNEYGKKVEGTDFTGLPDLKTHTNPHHHTREYEPGFGPKGGMESYPPGPGPNTGGGK